MPTAGREVQRLLPEQRKLLEAMETQWLQMVLTGGGKEALDEARTAYESSHISINASRKNNRHMLQAFDRMLSCMGIRLDHYRPTVVLHPREESEVEYKAVVGSEQRLLVKSSDGKKSMRLPRMDSGDMKDVAPVLHLSLDQGGIGMPMTLFLLLKERLRLSMTFDLNHRIHNDVLLASTHCGLVDLRLEAKVAMKARTGPFQSGSFLHCMRGVAHEYFSLHTYENPLFQVVYEEISERCSDSVGESAAGSQAHMLEVWERLQKEAMGLRLDAQPEQSRWFSWEVASRHYLPQRWLYVMLLTYLGMKRKWYGKLQETPLYTRRSKMNAEAFESTAVADDALNKLVDDEAEGEHEEVTEGGDDVAPSKSKKEALMKLANRRKRLCTLAFVLQLLCDEPRMRLWQGLANVTHPLEKWYRHQWQAQRVREHAANHLVKMQTYEHGLGKVVAELFEGFVNRAFLVQLGVAPYGRSVSTTFTQSGDQNLLNSLLDFVLSLAGELCLGMLVQRSPPHSFLLLLSEEDQTTHLAKLQSEWSALEALESSKAKGDAEAKTACECMLYPAMSWVRETFVRLSEKDFAQVPPTVLQQLQQFAGSHMGTLLLENSFNHVRRVNQKTRSKNMSAQQVWHSAMTSQTGADFGRAHVEPTTIPPVDHAVFRERVFESTASNVYDESALDEMLATNPSWPTPSPAKIKLSALMWHSMCSCNGQIECMRDSWKNLLLSPGLLFLRESLPNQPYLVLSSHLEGVIAHRVRIARTSNSVHLVSHPDSIICFFAVNPREFRVGVLEVRVQEKTDENGDGAMLVFRRSGNLLSHACRHGFPNMSLSQLRALGRYMELELGPRCTEEVLIRALLKKILNSENDEVYAETMRARCGASATKASVMHPVVLADHAEDGDADWEDAEIIHHIQEHRKHERARQQRAMRLVGVETHQASTTSSTSSAGAAASATTTTGDLPKPRVFNPMPESGLNESEARELAPSSAQLYKDTKENRWRVKSIYIENKSHTKARSYGSSSGTENEALLYLLLEAWRLHANATNEENPHSLDFLSR
eukprot:6485988-Amphidinium_carterae.4